MTKKLTAADYVHLHNHTQYSLLDGLTKIPELVRSVQAAGMEALAITDHGTLSGAIEFYKEAMAVGLKPIIGMEAYVAARRHTDKDPAKDRNSFHLTILAMNQAGYQNLMRLSTIANLDGFYYKPRLDRQLLERYSEGLIILSGCMGGEVSDALLQGQYGLAKATAGWYKKVFGDRYYIELMDHGHPAHPSKWADQERVNRQLLKLAAELNLQAVVTNDAHYLNKADQQAHEILLCVQTGAFLADEGRMSLRDFELHVADPAEIIGRWGQDHPELITNTKALAERCNLQIELNNILIPKFEVPKGETERSYLEKLVWQGLAWRYGGCDETASAKLSVAEAKRKLGPEVIERAAYELGVIERMGFNGYFLIVADFITWGKQRGIVFGPGRGSTAGSIVAYATRITELDPLSYDLLFERFLNPDRISMPDMDIDIQDSRREEVINYVVEKYGRDRVANIVTFGRMAARNAVRDVARVLQVPYSEADRMAKMIPPPVQGRHIPLKKSLADVAELKQEYRSNPTARRVFDMASQLEGTIRSHGVHAAGVVIAPDDIVKFVPLEMAQKGVIATQYSMWPIEDLGLLKMDFLGLSNLTIIKNTLRIVKKVHDREIDITAIPLDDSKTFELLQRGETTGVFQLESAGMKRYLRELKPTVFDDIVAMVALYRPGPMQWIDDFIARKHGLKAIEYLHPAMEPALNSTYGIIVYQEQVMQISIEMCGFSGGQADTLRKAIGKKIPEVMAKLKTDFIEGGVATVGAERRLMERFWKQLEAFAAYCFNKSHAACYGLIAYQTAYLKAHYPEAFMAALMTSDYDNTDRLAIEINECKHMGMTVLLPDVNQSFHEFAVVPGSRAIRFGLDAVKNVGHGAVEEILRARQAAGGSFASLEAFFSEVNIRIVNRKSLESLVRAGAFDDLAERGQLLDNLDTVVAFAARLQREKLSGQVDLFGDSLSSDSQTTPKLNLLPGIERQPSEYLQWERELLGLYLSQHPLSAYDAWLAEHTMATNELSVRMDGKAVVVGGSIVSLREITTKSGAKMAFVQLADQHGELELVVFPGVYEQAAPLLQRDQIILASGKLSGRDREGNNLAAPKVLADKIEAVDVQAAGSYRPIGRRLKAPLGAAGPPVASIVARPKLFIRLGDTRVQAPLRSLKQLLDRYRGDTEVVLVTGSKENRQVIRLPQNILVSEESQRDLAGLFGAGNIALR